MSLTPDFRRRRNSAPAKPQNPADDQDLTLDEIEEEIAEIDKKNPDQQKKKKKAKTPAEFEMDRLQGELEQRLEEYESLYPKHNPPHRQSANEKAEHLAGLTPEGVAGEMLAAMIFHLFATILNLAYIEQKRKFAKAQSMGKSYEQRADGSWPHIYPIGKNGKPYVPKTADGKNIDWTRVNTDGTASRQAVRANGFVPPPSLEEAYEMHLADFMLDMNGQAALTPYQRRILNIAEQAREKVESDVASDLLATRRPAPTKTR